MILRILMGQGDPAASCHHQENKPRNLQPQLMQHPSERVGRRSDGASRCPHRPAALGLLRRNPRHHP
jgi:hypothetical protein